MIRNQFSSRPTVSRSSSERESDWRDFIASASCLLFLLKGNHSSLPYSGHDNHYIGVKCNDIQLRHLISSTLKRQRASYLPEKNGRESHTETESFEVSSFPSLLTFLTRQFITDLLSFPFHRRKMEEELRCLKIKREEKKAREYKWHSLLLFVSNQMPLW